ncbi:MAG: dephospho-CoA kinase [Acidimicrobiia bacterium]
MAPDAQARVVLTGGIGSGKSTAGRLLASLGAEVIDADEVGHAVLEPGGVAFEAVAARWPDFVADQAIDRTALGRLVFSDPAELRALESLTHPAIRSTIRQRLASVEARVVVVEVPLLSDFLGDGWRRIVVDTPDSIRKERLLARGMTEADVDQRMAAQPSRAEWLEAADLVLDNAGTAEDLAAAVAAVFQALRSSVGEGSKEV